MFEGVGIVGIEKLKVIKSGFTNKSDVTVKSTIEDSNVKLSKSLSLDSVMNVEVSPLLSVNPVVIKIESPVYVWRILVKLIVTAELTGLVYVKL